MTVLAVVLAQAMAQDSQAVIPSGSSFTLLMWLALYVGLLFAWAITSSNVTMAARKRLGRSAIIRWVTAVVGIVVFMVVPALAARLLLPSAVLLAIVPVIFSTIMASRSGVGFAKALFTGSGQTAVLTYRLAFRAITAFAEVSWLVLNALMKFDWSKLREIPTLARKAMERIRPPDPSTLPREVVLLQSNGMPFDPETDPRCKSFPKSVTSRLVGLLRDAVGMRASEVLITTGGQGGSDLRLKIDGLPVPGPKVSAEETALIARLVKTIAGLSTSATSRAQEGMIPILCGDRKSEVIVNSAPSGDRETITLQITADERLLVDGGLGNLGLDDSALETLRQLLSNTEGLVLVAGRADSGKSTTLYAALAEAVQAGRSVATVEPTPRHRLDNVPQIKPDGQRFAGAVEMALRHDPDVLMVRDILDRETAESCMRAAAAGRLVIAGVRADDAVTAVERLLTLGVDRGLARLAITGVVAERLVRVLCDSCKTTYQPPAELVAKLGIQSKEPVRLWREAGCPACRATGFLGRTGVFELLVFDESVKNALAADGASTTGLRDTLRRSLKRSFKKSAVAKVRQGVTSVQEISRVFK